MELYCADENATLALGARMASCLDDAALQFNLSGSLGAGKTTLVRGFLHGLGHQGSVKSPTYGLVERYSLEMVEVCHFDLYRLTDPEELEYIGWRDLVEGRVVSIFEWPERGAGVLSEPDVACWLSVEGSGRRVRIEAKTPAGESWLERLVATPSTVI